jgi:phosphate uptake regulator
MVGYSTFSVSLPKDWVKEVGIKPGDVVSVIRLDDGSLKIQPGISREEKTARRIVSVEKCDEPGLLKRIIIALYIVGADNIVISSRTGLSTTQIEEVKKAVSSLNGFGIVEQTSNYITVQSFVDPTKFPIDGLLRRLHTITSYMLESCYKAIEKKKKEIVHEVLMAEEEMDKIYWMAVRQLLYATKRMDVAKKIGLENVMNIAGNRLVTKLIEKIGDYAEEMAKQALILIEKGLPEKKHLSILEKDTRRVLEIYKNSFNSLLNKDPILANRVIDSATELEKDLKETSFILPQECIRRNEFGGDVASVAFALRTYILNLAQVVNFAGTIAEVALNRSLETENPICATEK